MTTFLGLDLAPITHAAWRDPASGEIVARARMIAPTGNLGSQAVELARYVVSTLHDVRPTYVSISPTAPKHLQAVAVAEIEKYGAAVVYGVRGGDAGTLLVNLERRVVSEQRCAEFKAQARAFVSGLRSERAVAA